MLTVLSQSVEQQTQWDGLLEKDPSSEEIRDALVEFGTFLVRSRSFRNHLTEVLGQWKEQLKDDLPNWELHVGSAVTPDVFPVLMEVLPSLGLQRMKSKLIPNEKTFRMQRIEEEEK